MAMPPPTGLGNSQRRTALTTQFSTRVSSMLVLCMTDVITCPTGEMANCTEMRPARARLLGQFLVVAELHLVHVQVDDAADDLLVQ
jgi:hypothetical protein